MADRHLLFQSVLLTPENYGGKVIIELAIAEPVVRRTAAGTTIALVAASIFEQPDVLRVVDGAHAGDPTRITISRSPRKRMPVWTSCMSLTSVQCRRWMPQTSSPSI